MESIGVRMLKIWGSELGESEIAVCILHPDWDYRWSGIPPFDLHPERSGRYRGLQSQAPEDDEGKRYPSLGPSGTETDGQKYFLRTGVLQPQTRVHTRHRRAPRQWRVVYSALCHAWSYLRQIPGQAGRIASSQKYSPHSSQGAKRV